MLLVIVNPTAGNGRAAIVVDKVCHILAERGIGYRCLKTTATGNATVLVKQALEKRDADKSLDGIVCIGGDGTLSEVINGLGGRKTLFYIVPCGTGNDLARTLRLPKDPIHAFLTQLDNGENVDIDVGRVNNSFFINQSGAGFDVEVLRQSSRFRCLGKLSYLMGVLTALRHYKPLSVTMTLEDGTVEQHDMTIYNVANGQYLGGGMKGAPHAKLTDGLFDLIYADAMSRFKLLALLSRFMNGSYVSLPVVHEKRCRRVTMTSPGMTINMDGELRPMDKAEYSIVPAALTVRIPLETQ